MDRIITYTVLLSVLKTGFCFNINPVAWRLWRDRAAGFGYQVVQRPSDLLVSAPLEQHSQNKRGQIYKCSGDSCQSIQIKVPDFAVNMSLGLTMTSNPITQSTMACGPTIPKDCKSITLYNGVCLEITKFDFVNDPVPSSPEECRTEADIAFLLDGSGSVSTQDFKRMKDFVKNLVRSFSQRDTKFAVAQFSRNTEVHYDFKNFFQSGKWEKNIDSILQQRGITNTASAITTMVNLFNPSHGSRPNVKKVLIVITDGASSDSQYLRSASSSAEKEKIVRFAIGVGNAFLERQAKRELDIIASSPAEDHVFKVDNFDALEQIRQKLQEKIFSIEGSQSSGESLKMEMAQEGFSAAYVQGGIQLGTVGANTWRGGYRQYRSTGQQLNSFEPSNVKNDSYLGYSMAVATTTRGQLTIIGAPRYEHRGAVMTSYRHILRQKIDPFPWEFQIGEYFGAEVCAMDVNNDGFTDLSLISAPMFKDTDREGRVYVCILSDLNVDCQLDSPLVLRGDVSDKGRFGSSLAVLPDLNADSLSDLAVGAPLENDGQGSIYIFHGQGQGKIRPSYSQRIAGSEVASGLKFFGISISQLSSDLSQDNLPDIAVGSKGAVVVLRSQPIVMVEAFVSFKPTEIPIQNSDCFKSLSNVAEICLMMTRRTTVDTAQARINYSFIPDATRKAPKNRAYIGTDKQRETTGSTIITLGKRNCFKVPFLIEACPEDALNSLSNEFKFTFDGLPSNTNLKPSLAEQAQTTTIHPLGFEINCGADEKCVDNLKVDFNFTTSSEFKVGIDELLNVTVSLENREENAYNSRVTVTYPAGLSFRKFKGLQGRIECSSLDSENDLTLGVTECNVDKPIFKSNSTALFVVSYGLNTNSQLEKEIVVTANATSGNQEHSSSSELYKTKELNVKYIIFIKFGSSRSYNNFTFGYNNLQKPFNQSITVKNDIRPLNFTVAIRVPVKLGDQNIWADSNSLKIPDCEKGKEEKPNVQDFLAQIKKTKVLDCSVASCRVFKCSRFMGREESVTYRITANLSSGWIEQIGLHSAKFLLTSTASLEGSGDQYIFLSTGSNDKSPIGKIVEEVEIYPKPDFTKEIVGGSLGGLALLALLYAGLYKAGFFKSKYKDMINEDNGEEAGPGNDEDATTS